PESVLAVKATTCFPIVTLSRHACCRSVTVAGEARMTNATGIRRPDELVHSGTADPPARADQPGAARARSDELIAIAAREMDRLHEQIREAGCALLLTDSNGAILHEKSNAVLQGRFRVHRVGMPVARMLAAERDVAAPALRAFQHSLTLEDLAGEDPQMLRNVRSDYRIADSGVSVLIQGPTGSGKEAFAHAMHLVSRRAERPFVAVNCAAIPETLIESELFGYKSGAFTGARKEGMRGKILQSAGGTLFLDEIGDMPLTLQTRLLRVLEEQEIVPLGSETAIKVDLHVIAASHRNLREMIANGTFREDLYYRLNGITLELPALRDRADKERVIHHALAAETGNGRPAAIEMDALQRLVAYPWPGNIRELRNVIRTALAICEGGVVRGIDLPREIRESQSILTTVAPTDVRSTISKGSIPANPLQVAERAALLSVIDDCHGNMTRVAMQLGMSRNTLYRRIKRHG